MNSIPEKTTVLVIGGGPSGSFASAALAREGVEVVCLEAAHFPRYHIGESMLASVKPFLRIIGALEKVQAAGFTYKPGAAIKFNKDKKEAYTDFVSMDKDSGAWNVVRSEFDKILLDHAESEGAKVHQGTKIIEIHFDGQRPVSATWSKGEEKGKISFDYLLDASGRNGVMSTKYLKNREMNKSLKNVAIWSYWDAKRAKQYGQGTARENAPFFEGLDGGRIGWAWFIPLHNGKISVGVVMNEESSKQMRTSGSTLRDHYLNTLKSGAPGVLNLLDEAEIVESKIPGEQTIRMASDYSYSATQYSGDHYRLAGDAAAFIDPFFSSGVHLAFTGGLSAASSICASIRGDVSESQAQSYHDKKVRYSYTRFLFVVKGAYKQLQDASETYFTEQEASFDSKFDLIRPVIQGLTEVQQQNGGQAKVRPDHLAQMAKMLEDGQLEGCTAKDREAFYGATAYGKTMMDKEGMTTYKDVMNAIDTPYGPMYEGEESKQSTSYKDTSYKDANYKNTSYKDTSYRDASYKDASYKDASYRDASYKNASYRDASYKNASYKDTSYKDASYKDTSYKNASYKDTSYKNASYKDTSYKNASYKDASYKDTSYKGVSYKDTQLSHKPQSIIEKEETDSKAFSPAHHFSSEEIDGLVAVLNRGALSLRPVAPVA